MKDKNAPKRPETAYLLFSREVREEIKKKNPDATFGELAKKIAKKWRNTPDSEKKEYQATYEENKKKYEKALKAYNKKKEQESSSSSSSEEESSSSEESKSTQSEKSKE